MVEIDYHIAEPGCRSQRTPGQGHHFAYTRIGQRQGQHRLADRASGADQQQAQRRHGRSTRRQTLASQGCCSQGRPAGR